MSQQAKETRLAERLRRGEQPSADELREHLLEVHRQYAGFTETCAWASRDRIGRNSYEWLAELVEGDIHRDVLDLACGSGRLTALCHERHGDRLRLIGLDMSEDELALARERLSGANVELRQGMAQAMDFLEDTSVDVVLCHWALTLMDPVQPVLEEVARVLRPGGVFGAIVDGDMRASPNYEAIHHLIYDAVSAECPGYGEIELGDPRVRCAPSLLELAQGYFPRGDVGLEPSLLRLEASPARLARVVAEIFYASFVLSPAGAERLISALEDFFRPQAVADQAVFSMPIHRLVARKAVA
ncbi:MAG: class I SAM-dependent methyltransferase [Pseudomonadota bacterium]